MKIVLFDKCTLTTGDMDFSPYEELGEVVYYDIVPRNMISEYAKDADVILCNKAVITRDIMEKCKKLKLICLFATGYNNIDIKAAHELGIYVCNAPGYSTYSVAQEVFAFILNFANRTYEYNQLVQDGSWIRSQSFTFFHLPTSELYGKTLAVFGYGSIGMRVAEIANAFGMKVIVYSRTKKDCPYEWVSKEELFRRADYMTVHCPLNEETLQIINRDTIKLMKKSAYLINTSRGGVINENDLAEALRSGVIAGAGIDVLSTEPMSKDCPLLGIDNCVINPHIAWATKEARERLLKLVASNIKDFIDGKELVNRV